MNIGNPDVSGLQDVALTSSSPEGLLDREHFLCYSKRSPFTSYAPSAECSLSLLIVP